MKGNSHNLPRLTKRTLKNKTKNEPPYMYTNVEYLSASRKVNDLLPSQQVRTSTMAHETTPKRTKHLIAANEETSRRLLHRGGAYLRRP